MRERRGLGAAFTSTFLSVKTKKSDVTASSSEAGDVFVERCNNQSKTFKPTCGLSVLFLLLFALLLLLLHSQSCHLSIILLPPPLLLLRLLPFTSFPFSGLPLLLLRFSLPLQLYVQKQNKSISLLIDHQCQ
ncbi:hypothetical protein ILYODFUR_022767 [Ilyodon furcidens]|uniref:Transmembrane protein n=1 Tax=Ilyodon furcidens TaxID=33524 RepID=A0ABV0TZS7_9TELE